MNRSFQADQAKIFDRARLLPLIGLMFLVPPLANIFHLDLRILGIPFLALYLFAIWGFLIFGAARLASRLDAENARSLNPASEDSDSD